MPQVSSVSALLALYAAAKFPARRFVDGVAVRRPEGNLEAKGRKRQLGRVPSAVYPPAHPPACWPALPRLPRPFQTDSDAV